MCLELESKRGFSVDFPAEQSEVHHNHKALEREFFKAPTSNDQAQLHSWIKAADGVQCYAQWLSYVGQGEDDDTTAR